MLHTEEKLDERKTQMKFQIKSFYLTLLMIFLPLEVAAKKFVCKDGQNKLFIKFDYNNKKVHSANKQIYKYNIKDDLITWNSFTENKNHKIVRSFYFQKKSGKLTVDTHSLIHGLNKQYQMICKKLYLN